MKQDPTDKILNDLQNKVNTVAEVMANDLAYQIEATYEGVIELFYASYDPIVYDRTFSTYLASSGYDNLFSSQNIYYDNNIWTTGIDVGASNIPGNPYRIDKEWVFNRTYEKGIHGINIIDVRKRNARIWEKYKKTRLYSKKLKSKHKKLKIEITKPKGVIKIRTQLNNFNVQNSSIPKNMIPPPRKIMDREFKQIIKKKNLDEMFNRYMSMQLKK